MKFGNNLKNKNMLLGKLATPAVKVFQDGPFKTTNATAEYLVVSTRNYVIGGSDVAFEIRFGNIITEKQGDVDIERFDSIIRDEVKLTTEELASWGSDDSVVLDLIAAKLGTSIVEKTTKDLHYTY